MRGELYIDGKDAYTDFGVWITEGGYDGLLPFPELVEPDRNDWPDEDGIEPDLEKPIHIIATDLFVLSVSVFKRHRMWRSSSPTEMFPSTTERVVCPITIIRAKTHK